MKRTSVKRKHEIIWLSNELLLVLVLGLYFGNCRLVAAHLVSRKITSYWLQRSSVLCMRHLDSIERCVKVVYTKEDDF